MGGYLVFCNWLPFYGYVKNLKDYFKQRRYLVLILLRRERDKKEGERGKERRGGELESTKLNEH